MNKIFILVEGQTEFGFVKRELAAYFGQNFFLIPIMNTTKPVKSGPDFKGGITHYQKIKKQLLNLLKDSSSSLVTTMFDYYGLPDDFPGFLKQKGNCYERVKILEEAFREDISHEKFIPHFQLHEFEALLFSNPSKIDATMLCRSKESNLQRVLGQFNSPEEINDNPQTCPSQRILKEYPDYQKTLHGQIISSDIGIRTMLDKCSHFAEWIQQLTEGCDINKNSK